MTWNADASWMWLIGGAFAATGLGRIVSVYWRGLPTDGYLLGVILLVGGIVCFGLGAIIIQLDAIRRGDRG